MEKPISKEIILSAFTRLDELIDQNLRKKVHLIMGGGGAMILAHKFPIATTDVDAIPKGIDISELDVFIKQISLEKKLPGDWLNPYFSQFAYTLPSDFESRLIEVFSGKQLTVQALGCEDMLILKCFAHRKKDIVHARQLLKLGANIKFVESRINELLAKKIPNADEALDFLDDLVDEIR